jgi:hypothetical protein
MATSKLEKMKSVLELAISDDGKFQTGNKSAGTRVRGAMQEIKKLAQEVRLDVQEKKNAAK